MILYVLYGLTVTKVVFELFPVVPFVFSCPRLTVTKVVFELRSLAVA